MMVCLTRDFLLDATRFLQGNIFVADGRLTERKPKNRSADIMSHFMQYGDGSLESKLSNFVNIDGRAARAKHSSGPRVSMFVHTRSATETEALAGWQTQVSHLQQTGYGL